MGVVGASDAFMNGKATRSAASRSSTRTPSRFTLKSPDLSFLNAVTMDFCDVVPKEWVDKWGKQFNRHPLGTGPFVFQKWTPGREIVLTRNPELLERGQAYLDGIDYQLFASPPPPRCSSCSAARSTCSATASRRRPGARHDRPEVEAAGLLAAARRHQLPVHERDQ